MATSVSFHQIEKTELSAPRLYRCDGREFWSQEIIVHFEDGRQQSIDLYSNKSPDALIVELQCIENSATVPA